MSIHRLLCHLRLAILSLAYIAGGGTLLSKPGETTSPRVNRIASGTIAGDEIILELLQRSQQLDRLIAVSSLWGHAEYSRLNTSELPSSIEGRVGDSIEALLRLRPDLVVLASYNRVEFLEQLRKSGVRTLIQQNFRSIAEIKANINEIGEVLDLKNEAKAMVGEMDKRLSTIKASPLQHPSGRPIRYLNYSYFQNFYGEGTSFHSKIEELSGINLIADLGLKGWNQVNDEVLLTLEPDVIIAPARTEADRQAINAQLSKSPWRHFKAVQNRQVVFVNSHDLQSVSHHIVSAVEQIHSAVAAMQFSESKD